MESKNVKIIDEHEIDRNAKVICKFTIDNSNYVLYSIERDNENDNLFASKLVDNNDGTSNMVNIEDTFEKNKINDIVKKLITTSINSEKDNSNGNVVLSDGKNIVIGNAKFNKEQRINVPKTYVTTVKKAVTKVSEDFYKMEEKKEDLEKTTIFETLPNELIDKKEDVITPAVDIAMPEIKLADSNDGIKENEINNNFVEKEKTVEVPLEQSFNNVQANFAVNNSNEVGHVEEMITPIDHESKPEPVVIPQESIPSTVDNNEVAAKEEVIKKEEAPIDSQFFASLTSQNEVAEEIKVNGPVIKPVEEVKVEPISQVIPADIPSVSPTLNTSVPPIVVQPETLKVNDISKVSEEPKLFFDGSNESNLNKALGEVSQEKVVTTQQDGVESLREFGEDNSSSVTDDNSISTGRSKGFANNKFFMVIAIAFFVAACIFLGYEAFQYFQLVE